MCLCTLKSLFGNLSPFNQVAPLGSGCQQLELFESREAVSNRFSDFIVYVDESGDHGLKTVDQNYPVFALAFCVFHKKHYCQKVVPALQEFKFRQFGHDLVVLHELEIRKESGPFKFSNREAKLRFIEDLSRLITINNFVLISCVIRKDRLLNQSAATDNPYHLALSFCLESLAEFLMEKNQFHLQTHLIVECRGKKEDTQLELEFRRICDGFNRLELKMPFEIVFADKRVNSAGLQLADLVARPIGLGVLKPDQKNRAFELLKSKFFCSGGRNKVGVGFEGWGLKIYPAPESEKPR